MLFDHIKYSEAYNLRFFFFLIFAFISEIFHVNLNILEVFFSICRNAGIFHRLNKFQNVPLVSDVVRNICTVKGNKF